MHFWHPSSPVIIEVTDKRGPDNRGCTVLNRIYYMIAQFIRMIHFPTQAIHSQDTEAIESSDTIYTPPRLMAHRLLKAAALQNHLSLASKQLSITKQLLVYSIRATLSLYTLALFHR